MRLLLRCSSDGDYEDDIGKYAIIDFTDDLVKLIAKRRKAFIAAKQADDQLNEMIFRDYAPDWYPLGSTKDEIELGDLLDDASKEKLEIDDDFEVDEADNTPSETVLDFMVVDEKEVKWIAMPDHGDHYCHTTALSYEFLFAGRL